MKRQEWEYMVVCPWSIYKERGNELKWAPHAGGHDLDAKVLNYLGRSGWELVSYQGEWDCMSGANPTYIMKRPYVYD